MSLSRRALMALGGLALTGGFFAASAALPPGFTDYSKEKLDAALKGAKPVLVHVHADWCPICVRQERAFKELSEGRISSASPRCRSISTWIRISERPMASTTSP